MTTAIQLLVADADWAGKLPSGHPVIHAYIWFTKMLVKYMVGRAFFVTGKGYMGVSPAGTRVGDCVVIALGARTPFIMRQSSPERWWLGGECFVNGVMKGEVLQGIAGSSIVKYDIF
jgi:hypothetical protein